MNWITEHNRTLDDIEFPKTIYKYRNWEDDFHDRFIKKREIFLSSPSSFDDEKDCINPIRYDLLTYEQTIEFYEYISKRDNIGWTTEQHKQEARTWANKELFKDKKLLEDYQKHYNEEHFKRIGVLSLTAEPNLDKMWKKYANNGKGFCIGYNTRIMFEYLGGGSLVKYFEQLPVILPFPFTNFNQRTFYQIYCKENKWNFEQEYRTIHFWENPTSIKERQIQLPKEAFREIILGENISEKNKKEIIESVKINIGEIPIIEKIT